MPWREVEYDAVAGIGEELLAGLHGLEDAVLALLAKAVLLDA